MLLHINVEFSVWNKTYRKTVPPLKIICGVVLNSVTKEYAIKCNICILSIILYSEQENYPATLTALER